MMKKNTEAAGHAVVVETVREASEHQAHDCEVT